MLSCFLDHLSEAELSRSSIFLKHKIQFSVHAALLDFMQLFLVHTHHHEAHSLEKPLALLIVCAALKRQNDFNLDILNKIINHQDIFDVYALSTFLEENNRFNGIDLIQCIQAAAYSSCHATQGAEQFLEEVVTRCFQLFQNNVAPELLARHQARDAHPRTEPLNDIPNIRL